MWMGFYQCVDCHEIFTDEMLNCGKCPDCGGDTVEFTDDLYCQEVARISEGVI